MGASCFTGQTREGLGIVSLSRGSRGTPFGCSVNRPIDPHWAAPATYGLMAVAWLFAAASLLWHLGVQHLSPPVVVLGDVALLILVPILVALVAVRRRRLVELQQQCAALFEFNPQPAFLLDTQGRYRQINPAALELTGYRTEEVLGHSFTEFLVAEELDRVQERFASAAAGTASHFDASFHCRDGRRVELICTAVPLVIAGKVVGVGGTCQDTTELRRQTRRLQESEERYRAVLAAAPIAVFSMDQQGRMTAASPAAHDITGYGHEQLTGMDFRRLVLEEDLPAAGAAFARALQGEQQNLTVRVHHRDGSSREVAVTAVPVWADGELLGVAVLAEDITERVAAERRLRDSEQRLRAMFDSSIDGILVMDDEDRVVEANRAASRALYRGERELIGLNASDCAVPQDKRSRAASEVFGRFGRFRGELTYRRGDGSTFPVDVSAVRFRGRDGRAFSSVFFKDLSRRRRAEAWRRELEQVLEATSDVVALVRDDGRLMYLNEAGRELVGLSRQAELRGLSWYRLAAQGGAGVTARQSLGRARETGLWQGESALRGGSGTAIPVSLVVLCQDDGRAGRHYAIIARDISDAKQLEAALRQSEGRYRSLIETAAEGVWMVDAADCNCLVNPALSRLLGYSAEEMLGRPLYDFLTPAARVAAAQQMRLRRAGLTDVFDWELRRKDGSLVWALVSATPLFDEAGRYQGALGLLTDITERKQMELRLEHSRAELQRLSGFLSSVREQEQKRISRDLARRVGPTADRAAPGPGLAWRARRPVA